ncbi:MAG: glycosyltransferase family 2 protein [Planctomycetia bacterium]|nr:glycosyltransferase family 2 protein [Planctomycetia bacterium]
MTDTRDNVQMNIAVVMTCHNRRNLTIACLRSLKEQTILTGEAENKGYSLSLWLLDDASTDGTAEAVKKEWPGANITTGDGKRYWCGGMREAWERAAGADPDYFLLMNDDTTLEHDALEQLLRLAPTPEDRVIAVAAIADPRCGRVVFGGHKGHKLTPVQPAGKAEECDTMNANCTLITRAVRRSIGGLHSFYTHSMGDFDYGFAASRRGIRIVQSPKVLGFSEPNPTKGTWRDKELSKTERLELLWLSPTRGLPFLEWCTYCFRNHGWRWLYKCFSPTIRILAGK